MLEPSDFLMTLPEAIEKLKRYALDIGRMEASLGRPMWDERRDVICERIALRAGVLEIIGIERIRRLAWDVADIYITAYRAFTPAKPEEAPAPMLQWSKEEMSREKAKKGLAGV